MAADPFRGYGLQRFIGSHLIPDFRVSSCCRIAAFGAQSVAFYNKENALRLRGVNYCSSVWTCSICSPMIRRRRGEIVERLFTDTLAAGLQLHFVTLTFTLDATMGRSRHDLAAMLSSQSDAWRQMVQSRAFKVWKSRYNIVHYMRSLEITHGLRGWHPHFHLVFASPLSQIAENELFFLWSHALRLNGAHMSINAQNYQLVSASDVREVSRYVSAWGAGSWSLSHEMTKEKTNTRRIGSRTPMQLAADAMLGDQNAAELFRVYAHATKGMRATTFSRGWLAAYSIDDDEVLDLIVPEQLDGELLVAMSTDDFPKLRSRREVFFAAIMARDIYQLRAICRVCGIPSLYHISSHWFGPGVDRDWVEYA